MRRVGLWIVAVCVGYVATLVYKALVFQLFGLVTGVLVLAYGFSLVLVFAWTTAFVVSWLEVVKAPRARSRVTSR